MLHLFTLGGLALEHASASARSATGVRRKALAILAVIARSGSRGIARERLAWMFWPDSDEDRARQVLRQTLYGMRKELGDIIDGTTELRLDSALISSDVDTFERQMSAGDIEGAVAVYRGPFLDGVQIKGAPEFERWADTERGVLARRYYGAVVQLARDAERRNALDRAIEWWAKAADAFPEDGPAATGLLSAHLASGNRAAAVRSAEKYVRHLRAHLELEPDPSFLALYERIRTTTPATDKPAAQTRPVALAATEVVITPAVPAQAASPAAAITAARGRRWLHVTGAIVAAFVLTSLALFRGTATGGSNRTDGSRSLAVFPVRVIGDTAYSYLRDGVSHLLTASLDGTRGLTLIDAMRMAREASEATPDPVADAARIAARLDVDLYVVGDATVARGGQMQIDARLIDRAKGNQAIASAVARGNETDLFSLADEVARQLLINSGVLATGERGRASARTTTSLAAYKAFLNGESQFRAAAYAAAFESYQRAIAHDSAFALAYYRLSEAADWIGRGDAMMDAAERALRLSARLAPHDRLLFEAMYAWRHGDFDRAEVGFRNVVRLYPEDAEAWYQLGEVRYHGGPLRGRPFISAVEPFQRSLALDSTRTESLVHLVRIAAAYGELGRMDSLAAILMERQSGTPAAANTRAFLTMAHGDRRAIDRLVDSMRTLSEHQIWPVASAGAQYARELDGAARLLRLMLEAPHRDAARYAAASLLSHIELTRGRGDAAVAALSVIPNVPGRVWSIGKRALLSVAPNGPTVSPDLLVALRDSLRRWEPRRASPGSGSLENEYAAFDLQTPRFAEYAIGLLSIKLGDLPDAERAAAALDTITGTPDERATARALALGLRAHMADAGGNATKALQLLEAPAPSISLYHLVELTLFPRERYLRARLLERAGRTKEALEWYASIGQGYPGELGYMGVATDAVKRLTAPR